MVPNPWSQLPDHPPYVLSGDVASLPPATGEATSLHLNLLPMPFMGDPRTASVLLLALNPGYHPQDDADVLDPVFRELAQQALLLGPTSLWCLDERIAQTPAYRWWSRRLRSLITDCGVSRIRRELAVVQWFPYHSAKFKKPKAALPSQLYTFDLVDRAVERGALIVILRSERLWVESVPRLKRTAYLRLRVPRSAYVTERNLPEGSYKRVKARIAAT